MNKIVNQLYLAIESRGIIYEGHHIATFVDGSSHIVIANIAKDNQSFKIKIGTEIHLYEYLDIIQPICLNETGLIKVLPCPQCTQSKPKINSEYNQTMKGIQCEKCKLSVFRNDDINTVITIWNNIPRRSIDHIFYN